MHGGKPEETMCFFLFGIFGILFFQIVPYKVIFSEFTFRLFIYVI